MERVLLLLAATLLLGCLAAAKEPPPDPWGLEAEAWKQGNPLAKYLAVLRHDAEYRADKANASSYLQTLAGYISWLGEYQEADRLFDQAFRMDTVKEKTEGSPLEGCKPADAEAMILRAAETNPVVMVNEIHHLPRQRVLITRLLKPLYDRGFRYLALETLSQSDVEALSKRGYPTRQSGYYTNDPLFADEIRQALEIGYTLVAYESQLPNEPGDTPIIRMNRRETGQARNLKERIFDRDPKAKVLVHAGMSHVSERPQPVGPDKALWVFMATRFRELTGIDPFTVDQVVMRPHGDETAEDAVYRDAVKRGWVTDKPVMVVDAQGRSVTLERPGYATKARVFLPRERYEQGRPDWMARGLGRQAFPVPEALRRFGKEGVRLVQAYFDGEPGDAIPVDQILLRPGKETPVLMMPRRRGGKFWLRAWDEAGKASEVLHVTLPTR